MAGSFDVFFSYATRNHEIVERVAWDLTQRGLRVFLDRWYLRAGQPWPQALEQTLAACGAVAVFIGSEGLGPWQQRERDLVLDRQGREAGFPVIPVLLTRADPGLGFLKLNTRVDLSAGVNDPEALAIPAINHRFLLTSNAAKIVAICSSAPGILATDEISIGQSPRK